MRLPVGSWSKNQNIIFLVFGLGPYREMQNLSLYLFRRCRVSLGVSSIPDMRNMCVTGMLFDMPSHAHTTTHFFFSLSCAMFFERGSIVFLVLFGGSNKEGKSLTLVP